MVRGARDYTFDIELRLKDAGVIGASAAAQVASSDQIVDLGTGRWDGRAMLNVTAIEVDDGNENYRIHIQLSSDENFGSDIVDTCSLELGDAATLIGDIDSITGEYELGFTNEVAGVTRQYVRAYTEVAGSIGSGGINYTANIAKKA